MTPLNSISSSTPQGGGDSFKDRRGELLWCMDGRANPLMHRERWLELCFSPHWRVGFLFLVLYPPPSPPPPRPSSYSLVLLLTHTHSLTHSLNHSLTHSRTHARTHSLTHTHTQLTHTHSHTHSITHTHTLTHTHSTHSTRSLTQTHSLTHSLTHPPTHPPTRPPTHPRTHALTHSLTLLLRGRRGTMCTVTGSDVRPGVPLASLGLRLFCVAGVGQCALPRGRMYAPGFRWRPWVSASFAWQAWDNVHCQGVGCTPRGSAGVPGSPPLLRGRYGISTAKGSDVRPGVPLASLGLRLCCVAGVGQCPLPRGRMYPPGFRWRPWVSASVASQAWDNVHCQGVGSSSSSSLTSLTSLTHWLTDWLTHWLTHSLTDWLTHSLTHTHTLTPSPTHSLPPSLTVHEHTYTHTNLPTITAPSLLYFLFPSCFSMLSLSLKKLVTCGVIRSFNLKWLQWLQWSPHPQLLDVVWCSAAVVV